MSPRGYHLFAVWDDWRKMPGAPLAIAADLFAVRPGVIGQSGIPRRNYASAGSHSGTVSTDQSRTGHAASRSRARTAGPICRWSSDRPRRRVRPSSARDRDSLCRSGNTSAPPRARSRPKVAPLEVRHRPARLAGAFHRRTPKKRPGIRRHAIAELNKGKARNALARGLLPSPRPIARSCSPGAAISRARSRSSPPPLPARRPFFCEYAWSHVFLACHHNHRIVLARQLFSKHPRWARRRVSRASLVPK